MESKLPQTLKKQSALIEGALYSDKYNRNAEYQRIIKKTQAREAVYERLKIKYGNLEEKADELCEKCSVIMEKLGKDLDDISKSLEFLQSKKDLRVQMDLLTKKANSYYSELGQLMNEYGLLDVLIERNDSALTKLGAQILKVDKVRAMEEFKTKPNGKSSYTSELMKILFYTNKIAKFIQDIEFGTMLNIDRMNAKTNNDERIQLLSNLKTHYLNFVVEEEEVLSGEEKIQQENDEAKKEYLRLFEEDFQDLDYEKEIEIVRKYNERVKMVYSKKSELTDMILEFGLHLAYRKYIGQDIKNCGICKDDKGKYVLGMNIQGYIMPLTVHISKSNLVNSLEHEGYIRGDRGKVGMNLIEIEEYEPLIGNDGKVVKTNLLYKINKVQMEELRRLARNRPEDPVIRFYNTQISKEANIDYNMIKASELLKD